MAQPPHTPGSEQDGRSRSTSYILRCWASTEGHLHARLIQVRTGASYAVATLEALPALLRQLLADE
ncbi:MAG: hypothetical protein HC893_10990 [Chloroflexaceae bacterium]|nr:hypothetical protein [Chloroflexaceae bacterium]NJL34285.1 hypothetical protein [Chloroflexaceae bacterium]NJO06351.1 hypothetical protein [Chloroflexaceae bacterium]NJO84278.1 hypothetical protein [Blastochloris sp.]